MANQTWLAVDIGASSGRVLAGQFDGKRIALSEVHRFENGPIHVHDRMYWDLLALWKSVREGLRKAADQFGDSVTSLGVDTWGVDYGLLGPGDELLGNPRHYRDPRTDGVMERTFDVVSRSDVFSATGLQFMPINSLYQMVAMTEQNPKLLDQAQDFLMIPDLFNWLLTGQKTNEFSNATTTQMFNPQTRTWATELLATLNIPDRIFRDTTDPGTNLGTLQSSVAESTGLGNAQVILPGTHDTASAVLAVPAQSVSSAAPDWCYISSGTWSLMGVELPEPVINEKCLELNFTNEGGVGGTVRLLKNIGGLWLIQECRRVWAEQGREYSWDRMIQSATEAQPLVSLINPDAPDFTAPKDMPASIREFCNRSGQPVPESDGAVVRCALESLAMRYRQVLGWLEQLTGGTISTIHIVGGGTQNEQLSQMAADACNRQVVAGPVEATAIGNAMMQAISLGAVDSIAAARQIIADSFAVKSYTPASSAEWDEAYARFEKL